MGGFSGLSLLAKRGGAEDGGGDQLPTGSLPVFVPCPVETPCLAGWGSRKDEVNPVNSHGNSGFCAIQLGGSHSIALHVFHSRPKGAWVVNRERCHGGSIVNGTCPAILYCTARGCTLSMAAQCAVSRTLPPVFTDGGRGVLGALGAP